MTRPVRAVIDLQALRHNLDRARRAAPRSRFMAVVKANGYGHGIERAGRALAAADAYAVSSLEEALVLRDAGLDHPILLLAGFFDADELPTVAARRLDIVVHHESQVAVLERARLAAPLTVWVKVDSGMHRLGFAPEAVAGVWARLRACAAVDPDIRFLTHLPNADDRDSPLTHDHIRQFVAATAPQPGLRSAANSAALLGWPETHFDWVRPGILLYGASPFIGGNAAEDGLTPVMTFSTRLIAVNEHRRGDAIGYAGTWTCPEPMRVGVAAVGYGDGYPRHLPSGAPVLVNGRRAALIGRVSMDLITIDLRAHPDAGVGDPVVLWGRGLPADEIARWAGTIPYELFCSVTTRVPMTEADGTDTAAKSGGEGVGG